MPCTANVNMLEKVAGSIEASKGVFVIDYLGLSVKETQELRRALREVGAQMKVYKNNIVKIALKNAGQPDIEELSPAPAPTCSTRRILWTLPRSSRSSPRSLRR